MPSPTLEAKRVVLINDVIIHRPLADALQSGADLVQGGPDLERLAQDAAAHRAEKGRLDAPGTVLQVQGANGSRGAIRVALGPDGLQVVGLDVGPVLAQGQVRQSPGKVARAS